MHQLNVFFPSTLRCRGVPRRLINLTHNKALHPTANSVFTSLAPFTFWPLWRQLNLALGRCARLGRLAMKKRGVYTHTNV